MAEGKLTPRLRDALAAWDALPADERTYAKVAEALNVTQGRAADYMRKALAAEGREQELPRGGNGTTRVTTPQSPTEMMQAAADQLRSQIDAQEARVREAREAAEGFDAEAFRTAEQARLVEQAKAAKAAADAWKNDSEGVASKAAEERGKALTERVDRVEAEVTERTEALRASLTQYERTLEALSAAA